MTCFTFAMCSCRGLLHWKSWILFMEMKWHFKCFSWNCRTSCTNHTAETRSNCRDHQWFQDGYNKGNYYYLVLGSTAWWFRHTVKSICGNKNLVSRAYQQAPVVVKVDSTMPYPGQITFHQITQMVSLKLIQWIALSNVWTTALWVPFSFNMRLQTNSKLKSCMLYTPGPSCSAKAD